MTGSKILLVLAGERQKSNVVVMCRLHDSSVDAAEVSHVFVEQRLVLTNVRV